MSNTILITGGTGFVGSHLVEWLHHSQPDAKLHVTSLSPSTPLLDTVAVHVVDFTNSRATAELITQIQPTQLYQLASIPLVSSSFERSSEILDSNQRIVSNVLEAIRLHSPQTRCLVVTSADIYGLSSPGELPISEAHPLRPLNPYAISKVTQDLLAQMYTLVYQLDVVRVRPFNHIGERQPLGFVVSDVAAQIVAVERDQQAVVKVGNLKASRDFTDVKDMVKAYELLMKQGKTGDVYNVGSGVATHLTDVVAQLAALSRSTIAIETDSDRVRLVDAPLSVADNSKIRALGWQPSIPLQQTLERVLTYWRSV